MKPLFKVPLKYGTIAGFLGAIFVIGLYYLGKHPFLISVFFDFRIFLFGVFIFVTLKEIRDYHQKGMMSFGEGLMASFIFVTVFGFIASAIIILFATREQAFVTSFITLFKEQVQSLGDAEVKQIGKENIERNLKALLSTNAFWMGWNYFKQGYWIGLIVSIILSITLRHKT